MTGASPRPASEKRLQKRHSVNLRVDLKALEPSLRQEILDGGGYYDLSLEDLSLSRPRQGLHSTQSHDVSASGLRLLLPQRIELEQGGTLVLDLHLPGDRRVVKLLGDVIWTGTQDGQSVAGVRIAALEEEGARRVKQFLGKLKG